MATAFGIEVVTNASLNIPLSTFSLQDALNPTTYGSFLYDGDDSDMANRSYVFLDACGPSLTEQDCTSTCQDAATVFGSLKTLRNCVAYSDIAYAYTHNNLSTGDQDLAIKLGIAKAGLNDTASSMAVLGTINSCLVAYCGLFPGCSADLNAQYSNRLNATIMYDTEIFSYANFVEANGGYGYFDICGWIPASVNQDIGGIGVYVSYWIQIGISLLGFLGIFIYGPGIYYLSLATLIPRHGFQGARQRAHAIGARLRKQRLPSLATALTDFQKAQCFFMLAINIAALINRAKGGLQPTSLQQLYNTYVLIKSVSISGYLPITFNLFTLHMVDMISWYLLILSFCTIGVSIATLFAVGDFSPTPADMEYLGGVAATGGPAECGQTLPGTWCYMPLETGDYYDNNPSSGAYPMLAFCLVVFLLLVAQKFQFHKFLMYLACNWHFGRLDTTRLCVQRWSRKVWDLMVGLCVDHLNFHDRFLKHQHTRRLKRWTSGKLLYFKNSRLYRWRILSSTQSEKSRKLKRRTSRTLRTSWIIAQENTGQAYNNLQAVVFELGWPNFLLALVAFFSYVVFFGLYVHFFMIFCNDLAYFAYNGVDTSSWSFGQIVAITVWAAPVCEYLHLELRGMRRGFEHRLLPPYKVVSQTDDEERGITLETPLLSPDEYSRDPKGAYEELAAETPTSPEEHRHSLQKGGYAEVNDVEESPISRTSEEEEEEDITWQLPDFRRSESIRLYDYE